MLFLCQLKIDHVAHLSRPERAGWGEHKKWYCCKLEVGIFRIAVLSPTLTYIPSSTVLTQSLSLDSHQSPDPFSRPPHMTHRDNRRRQAGFKFVQTPSVVRPPTLSL